MRPGIAAVGVAIASEYADGAGPAKQDRRIPMLWPLSILIGAGIERGRKWRTLVFFAHADLAEALPINCSLL